MNTPSTMRHGMAWAVVLVLATMTSSVHAEPLPDREVMVHGFRSPSTGIELRDGWLGFHLGVYPTIIDKAENGASRTTWFAKVGLTAYPLRFDTGSGRPSAPFISVGLLQGLNNAWNVSRDAEEGSAVMVEVGFRWAAWRGLDLRLGVGVLMGFNGDVHVNPTPGVSWAVPL